jgi:transposase
MDTRLERCAGLDVHQGTVVATVRRPGEASERTVETVTFDTMTSGLLALREWLQACGVTHVALESTGVYWKPVYYVLEDGFTLLLVNMRHLKHVPGRKSDVRDSEWLAQLLEYGLLRGSLIPPEPIRDLRDLTRYRKKQIQDRTAEVNRLYRQLEDAGVKLASVMTDVMGASGRAILEALLAGTTDPTALADLAQETARPAGRAADAAAAASRVRGESDSGQDRFSGRNHPDADRRDRSPAGPFRIDPDSAGHDPGDRPNRGDDDPGGNGR